MNDWSARDVQGWEYQPLGPFLAKNFCTSISPWVVPLDALAPFRVPPPPQDPAPLDYLRWTDDFSLDLRLEARLTPSGSPRLRPSRARITLTCIGRWPSSSPTTRAAAATCAPRDLLASGTVSGPEKTARGCLLELTWRGAEPLELPGGARRTQLEDGDRLTITGWAQGDGHRVGFGEVTGRVLPAA